MLTSQLMRHSSVEMTEKYLRLSSDEMNQKLESNFIKKKHAKRVTKEYDTLNLYKTVKLSDFVE